MSYFYRGRHRAPTYAGRRAAAVLSAVAVPSVFIPGVASAQDLPPDAVAQCESGGDITAKNPSSSASGKWQIIAGTWAANGGLEFASEARYATEREQDIVASRILNTQGIGAWDASSSCWDGQSSSSSGIAAEVKTEAKSAPVVEEETYTASTSTGDTYTVRSGDTLSNIAAVQGTTWQQLYADNDDVLSSPHLIFPGQELDV